MPEFYVPYDILGSDDESNDKLNFGKSSTNEKPQNLKDLIESEGFFDTITVPINVSRGELLFIAFKFSIVNKFR